MANLDYQYFHYGLYNKNNSFYVNGISFDSFNLDYLSNPLKNYSSIEDYDIDLKYLSRYDLYEFSLIMSLNKKFPESSVNLSFLNYDFAYL